MSEKLAWPHNLMLDCKHKGEGKSPNPTAERQNKMAQIMTLLAYVRQGYGANSEIPLDVYYQSEEDQEFLIELYQRLNAAWEEHADKVLKPYGAYVVGNEIHCPHYTSPDCDDYKPLPEDGSEEAENLWEQIYGDWDQGIDSVQEKIAKEMLDN